MDETKKLNLLKVLNVIAFLATIAVNALANTLPINNKTTGELSDNYPNLFTPAALTFSIWGLIYFLLLVFIIYQTGILSRRNKDEMNIIKNINFFFVLSCIGNIGWIFLWHYELVFLSVLAMFVILYSLVTIYLIIYKSKPLNLKQKLCVKLTFSIYLGWITVATIANITAALVDLGLIEYGVPGQIWTITAVAIAVIITLYVLHRYNDIAYSFVPLWALTGILIKHLTVFKGEYTNVIVSVIAGMIVVCIGIIITLLNSKKSLV